MTENFYVGQPVKHVIKDRIHEARFAGYAKSGRMKVTYNALYPSGVGFVTGIFNPKNIVSALHNDMEVTPCQEKLN